MDDKDRKIAELEDRIKKLENDLIHDELTGLKTRHYLINRAKAVLSSRLQDERRTDRYWVAVLFCDIDNFKQINDQHGHSVGDEVLKMVAQTIKKSLRRVDIVSRWGGEEIVVFMSGDLEGPRPDPFAKAEQIRQAVSNLKIPTVPDVGVSVSIGVVSTFSDSDFSVDDLIEKADKAMYQAKEAGKNQVVVAE